MSPKVTTTNGSDVKPSMAVMPRALTMVMRRNFAMLERGADWRGGRALDAAGSFEEGALAEGAA